jgi:hypothetical protein
MCCLHNCSISKTATTDLIKNPCPHIMTPFVPFVVITIRSFHHWICNKSNMTGATYGAGTAYLSGAPELIGF